MGTQPFHVLDEMPGGVLSQVCMGCRASAATLIEQNDAILGGVVKSSQGRARSPTRPAVHCEDRNAARITDFLIIDFMKRRNAQPSLTIRRCRRIKADAFPCVCNGDIWVVGRLHNFGSYPLP